VDYKNNSIEYSYYVELGIKLLHKAQSARNEVIGLAVKKNEFAIEMGRRIYQRRKQLGLTQEQAADRAELSHQYFASLERGEKGIAARNIVKLAKALETSTDYLLNGLECAEDDYGIGEWAPALSAKHAECLKNIIKSFMIAFGYNQQE